MKKRVWLLIMAGMCLVSATSFAVRVTDLYRAMIPVVSQSADERNQTQQQGLGQVLIKVTGNAGILQNPAIKSQLHLADSLMQEYGYAASSDKAKPYILQMDFDPDGVNKLLRDAKVPLWGQVRPLVLVWLDYETPAHPAEILNMDSANGIPAALKQLADSRGVPVIFPVMDVTEVTQVSTNDIATMAIPTLLTAAKRYESDAILIGRMTATADGFSAQWKLVLGDQQWDWTGSGKQVSDVLSSVTDNVANALAARYSGMMTNTVKTTVTLKISGVSAADDYTELMNYVSHLPPVMDVQPENVTGSDVILTVNLRGEVKLLTQAISLGQKLTPKTDASLAPASPTATPAAATESTSTPATAPTSDILEYQWNH